MRVRGRLNALLERLPLASQRPWIGYVAAISLSGIALAARFAINPWTPPGYPYLTFFPAVVLSSFLFGRGPGIFAGLLGGLSAWYYFIPPFHSFIVLPGTPIALGLYAGIVTVDIALIHWMQRATSRLVAERERNRILADRAELLFHELQHRVSNNLQMIGSVLSLQKRKVSDPLAAQALADAVAKLQTIGRVQRHLYRSDGGHLALDRFLPDVARDLIEAGGRPGIDCRVEAAPDIQLEPHAAIPVTLIMAEAVANAVEHGFATRESGTIRVMVNEADGWLDLSVADDGTGVAPDFDVATSDSLGLRIARTLAEQLGGSFTLNPAAVGSVARLHFPLDRRAPA